MSELFEALPYDSLTSSGSSLMCLNLVTESYSSVLIFLFIGIARRLTEIPATERTTRGVGEMMPSSYIAAMYRALQMNISRLAVRFKVSDRMKNPDGNLSLRIGE